MTKYNDDISFETDKKDDTSSRIFKRFLIFGLVIILLLGLIVFGVLSFLNRNVDTSLNTLSVDNGIISPEFKSNVYSYIIETDSDDIYFTCNAKDDKVKIDGCGKTIKLHEEENNIDIVVSYKKKKASYKFKVIKNSKFNIEINGNSDSWTDKDITLVVNATSLEGITLHNEAYSFDNGETWQKDNKKTFSENKTVKIRVRDIEGNTSFAKTIKISKIDKNTPSVKLSVSKKKLTAIVTPNKTPSEYSYIWYLNGKEITGANKVNYTAKVSGNYKVKVTSGIGKSVISEEVIVTTGTSYTVKYDANGGSNAPSDQIKVKDEELTITGKIPTRDGYKFIGWSISKDGEVDYTSSDKYNVDKSIILYAVWEKQNTNTNDTNATYTISYNANGGSNAPVSQTKNKDKPITLSSTVPTKADSKFLGWATTNGGSVVYQPGASYNQNKSVTLYAVWSTTKTITVTYMGNGAQINKTSVSSTGSNTFTLPGITRSGYTILGWSTSQTATSATYNVGQTVTFNDSITLYAITTKKITATFNKNTASKISKTSESCNLYNKATLCTVTTPTITAKSGKKVIGWSMYPNVATAAFKQNSKVAISSNTTLYAITK